MAYVDTPADKVRVKAVRDRLYSLVRNWSSLTDTFQSWEAQEVIVKVVDYLKEAYYVTTDAVGRNASAKPLED